MSTCDRDRRLAGHRPAGGRLAARVIMVILLWHVAACAAQPLSVTDSNPPVLVHEPMGRQAQVVGRLDYLPDHRCFVLDGLTAIGDADRPPRWVVVWPTGTRPLLAEGKVLGVDVNGFGEVRSGQWINGAGGYVDRRTTTSALPSVAPACLSEEGEFAFLDTIHTVTDVAPN